jgi:hypothetical protein
VAQVKDSSPSPQTQSYTYGLTVAAAPAPATPAASSAPLFQTGFEATDQGFDNSFNTTNAIANTNPLYVHSGTASFQTHFTVCPATDGSCGGASQDQNIWLAKMMSPGLPHFFYRAWVYFKAPENGIQGQGAQRKLLWAGDEASLGSNANWDIILSSFETQTGSPSTLSLFALSQGGSCYNNNDGTQWTSWMDTPYPLSWNTWYEIEIEVQTNTPSATGPYNGIYRVWVNGTKVMDKTDFRVNGNCADSFTFFSIGRQANRYNFQAIDEYRYWDDIAIGTSYLP